MRFASSQLQNWVAGPRLHSSKATRCRPAQQIDEHRFCLVVCRVPSQYACGQCIKAGRARTSLQVAALFNVHCSRLESGPKLVGNVSNQHCFRSRLGPQPMIYVPRRYLETLRTCQHQQRHRVGPTRNRAIHRSGRRIKGAFSQQLGHKRMRPKVRQGRRHQPRAITSVRCAGDDLGISLPKPWQHSQQPIAQRQGRQQREEPNPTKSAIRLRSCFQS